LNVSKYSQRQTKAKGAFIASNFNPVPQAGKYYDGPNLGRQDPVWHPALHAAARLCVDH
jgi:hypothetical protein